MAAPTLPPPARVRPPAPPAGAGPAGRPPGRRRGRVVAGVLSAAVLAASALGWAASERYLGKITQIPVFAGLADRPAAAGDGAFNVLLVASDDRAGMSRQQANELHLGHADYGRHTDTMILMHVAAGTDHVTMVSVPRDSLVTIPAYTDAAGKRHDAQQAKANAAYALGGPALTVRTLEDATGLRIDHYIEVNFAGFLRIVDAIGGVPVCLPKATKDKASGLDLPAGRSVVNGPQALAYVRARHIDATQDIGRIQRQQKFIASMLQQATSAGTLLNPVTFDATMSAAMESVTTDEGLDAQTMLELAQRVRSLDPKRVTFITVPIADGNHRVAGLGSTLLWDQTRAQSLFAALREDQPVTAPVTAKVTVAPTTVRVAVQNGSRVAGLGRRAADELAQQGFAVQGKATNADVSDAKATTVYYDTGSAAAAKTLLAALPGATGVERAGLGPTLRVVVGSDFNGTAPVKVSAPAPAAAKVRSAADDICG